MKSKSINVKNLVRELNEDYLILQQSWAGHEHQRAAIFEIKCQTILNLIEIYCLGKGHGVPGSPKKGQSLLQFRIEWVNKKVLTD